MISIDVLCECCSVGRGREAGRRVPFPVRQREDEDRGHRAAGNDGEAWTSAGIRMYRNSESLFYYHLNIMLKHLLLSFVWETRVPGFKS